MHTFICKAFRYWLSLANRASILSKPRFQLYDAFAANSFAKPHVFDILRSLSSMGLPAKSVDLSTASWGVLFDMLGYPYTQTQSSHLHSDQIQAKKRETKRVMQECLLDIVLGVCINFHCESTWKYEVPLPNAKDSERPLINWWELRRSDLFRWCICLNWNDEKLCCGFVHVGIFHFLGGTSRELKGDLHADQWANTTR